MQEVVRVRPFRPFPILLAVVAVGAAAHFWLRDVYVEPGHVDPYAAPFSAPATIPVEPTPSARAPVAYTGRIAGTVVDVAGTPVASASIELESPSAGRTLLTKSAEDGTFDAGGLEPGAWTVRAEAAGRRPETVDVALARDASARADLVLLRTRPVSVRIVDAEGAPLQARLDAEGLAAEHAGHVQVEQEGLDPVSLPAARLLANARTAFSVLEATPFRVRLVAGDALLDEVLAGTDPAEIVLRADVERIRSQAAWMELDFGAENWRSVDLTLASGPEPRRNAHVQGAGARIGVVPGEYVVDVAWTGRASTRHALYVAPGTLVTIRGAGVEPECTLRGRVVNVARRGLAAADVWVRPAGSDEAPSRFERTARADVNGWFTVRGLSSGRWVAATDARPGGVEDERTSIYLALPQDRDVELLGASPELSARAGSRPAIR